MHRQAKRCEVVYQFIVNIAAIYISTPTNYDIKFAVDFNAESDKMFTTQILSKGQKMTEMRLDHISVHKLLTHMIDQACEVIIGKRKQIKLAMCCLLSGGHLLLEDLPGAGKTTLSHLIAKLLGLEFTRIQFTSDLLPADVLGVSIFNKESGEFRFSPGPIFTQTLLADEINRATPKAQSALLEAMEEGQVTVDGDTRQLPKPFFVIATQNPNYQIGTFPLPESQLDRFTMCVELGYPNYEAERAILKGEDRRSMIHELNATLSDQQILSIRQSVSSLHASDALLDYTQDIIEFTRTRPEFTHGLSPRGSLALLKSAKAWAYLDGRNHVLPEDIQEVLPPVLFHRLRDQAEDREISLDRSELIIKSVAIP